MADDRPPLPPESYSPGNPPLPRPLTPDGAVSAGLPGSRPPEIVLHPTKTQPAPHRDPRKIAAPPEVKDSFREIIETIVFVVVLVLLLKTFLAEAFVIPTGSMATTLLGYHRNVVCAKCGYSFLVNASQEAEPPPDERQPVISCFCPNCEFKNRVQRPLQGGMQ